MGDNIPPESWRAFQQALLDLSALPKSQVVSSKNKLRLYGLYSYISKGPLPPTKDLNSLMKNKPELLKRKSWFKASQLSKLEAISEYCLVVEKLSRSQAKSGYLYIKSARGVWEKIYVELQDRLLSYSCDSMPSGGGTVFLLDGCVVCSLEQRKEATDSAHLVLFSIAHPKSSKVFTLGAESMEIAQDWIDAIRMESNSERVKSLSAPPKSFSNPSFPPRLESRDQQWMNRPSSEFGIVSNLFSSLVDLTVKQFVDFSQDASMWVHVNESNGIQTFLATDDSELSKGDTVGVLGYCDRICAPARSVFDLLWKLESRHKVDSQMEAGSIVEDLGMQTRVDHLVYSAVWPISKRDFCRLVHYRVNEKNGSVLIVGVSVVHPGCAPIPNAIRGHLSCTGFLIQPLEGEEGCCRVKYLMACDPKVSSIPKRFVQSISCKQTQIIHRVGRYLEENDFLIQRAFAKGPMTRNPGCGVKTKRRSSTMGSATLYVRNEETTTTTTNQPRRFLPVSKSQHELALVLVIVFAAYLYWDVLGVALLLGVCWATLHFKTVLSFAVSGITIEDERVMVKELERILQDFPNLRGRYHWSGMWIPSVSHQVLVIDGSIRADRPGGYVYSSQDFFTLVLCWRGILCNNCTPLFGSEVLWFNYESGTLYGFVDFRCCNGNEFDALVNRVRTLKSPQPPGLI